MKTLTKPVKIQNMASPIYGYEFGVGLAWVDVGDGVVDGNPVDLYECQFVWRSVLQCFPPGARSWG